MAKYKSINQLKSSFLKPRQFCFFPLVIITIVCLIIFNNIFYPNSRARIHLTISNVSTNHSSNKTRSNNSSQMLLSVQEIRCIVSVQNREGFLGNRMFLVASGYGFARLHLCHLYITPDIINELRETFVFDLSPLLISSDKFEFLANHTTYRMNRTILSSVCQYHPELTRPHAIPRWTIFEVTGYWQSYLHFSKYRNELRERIFSEKSLVLEKVSKFFIDIYQRKFNTTLQLPTDNHHSLKNQLSSITWISFHIHLGDFTALNFTSNTSYLFYAINYYSSQYSNPHFIVASDDKLYCENLFRNQTNIFITPTSFSPGDDLITLSLCQHSIITGGSFGWWTGYLANGEVLHDQIYPSGCERREQYYPPWFLINGNVRQHKNTDFILK